MAQVFDSLDSMCRKQVCIELWFFYAFITHIALLISVAISSLPLAFPHFISLITLSILAVLVTDTGSGETHPDLVTI